MALTKYNYSISEDFPNAKVNTSTLSTEIVASDIAEDLARIDTEGDDCDIWFDNALSGGDETTLDGIVAAHAGEPMHSANLTATTNPGSTDDINKGYAVGSMWVNTSSKFEFVCVDNTAGAAVWLLLTKETPDIHLSFGSDLKSYCQCGLTSWDAQRRFIFRGTDVIGVPTVFKACVAVSANTGDIRLYDATNSNTIAVVYNFTNTAWGCVSDTPLSNLPSGEALFEVQLKVDNGDDLAYVAAASLLF